MKSSFALLLVMLLLIGCGGGEDTDRSAAQDVLRVGIDATYPPFESINPATGQPAGFDIDLMTEICALNGWKPEFVSVAFDGLLDGLTGGQFDAAISAITITPHRAALVDFSDPYYLAGQSIAVSLKDSSTKGVTDLMGKKVGVQNGTTGEQMAKKMHGLHVYSYDNIGEAFNRLASGELDVVLNDYPTTRAYIKEMGSAKIVGEILSTEHYGIAVRKGEQKLLEKINNALEQIKQSGRFRELHLKWFNTPQAEYFRTDSV